VPLGDVARRLGQGVESLVGTYVVGALDGDDTAGNELIDAALGPSRAWIVRHRLCEARVSSRAPPTYQGKPGRIGVNDGQEVKRP
jgi:hypothetical protein